MTVIRKKTGLIIMCLLIILTGCQSQNSKIKEPKQVIESFFKYYNEKNLKNMSLLRTEIYNTPKGNWEFDNLDYIKPISIVEETDQTHKKSAIHDRY